MSKEELLAELLKLKKMMQERQDRELAEEAQKQENAVELNITYSFKKI